MSEANCIGGVDVLHGPRARPVQFARRSMHPTMPPESLPETPLAMPLNLIKLCVGCDGIDDLVGWIALTRADRLRRGLAPEHIHRTRMMPKRVDEILDGGSLYWVIKGQIRVREKVLALRAVKDEQGVSHCDIVLSGDVVEVEARPYRPFQGWRYLDPGVSPRDLLGDGTADLPVEFLRELAGLGLL